MIFGAVTHFFPAHVGIGMFPTGNGRFAMGGLSVNMMKQRSYVFVANLTLISEMTSTSPKNEGFPTKIPKNVNVPIFLVLLVVFSAIC